MKKTKKNFKDKVSKKLKTWIVIGVIALFVVVLVLIIILTTKSSSKTEKDNASSEPTELVTSKSLSEYNYKCERENIIDGADYKEIFINYIMVDNSRVRNTIDAVKIIYNDEKEYLQLKEQDKEKAISNDTEKSLEYVKESSKVDYTVDENGKELTIAYSKYKEALERSGHICLEIVK